MLQLGFNNTFARDLEGTYVPAPPRGFADPTLMSFDRKLATELGLPHLTNEQAAQVFSGTLLPSDANPIALAYAGHQFGGFTPQLGDGRAVLLGEVVSSEGARFDLQLKGSGATVFSRGGDGKAAVGPILRERLVSQAMYRLGIPTTRVLATVRTGETIRRQTVLPGAVLARVASSHLRVGTLQFFAARRQHDLLANLVTYTLRRHAPERADHANPVLALLEWTADQQALLLAKWMGVGFVHGVMNTDNVTLCGETIDYGPCAFLDAYSPGASFSSVDQLGRYAFAKQPTIGQWNLARMGEALLPLLDADADAAVAKVHAVLDRYAERYSQHRQDHLRAKLGLHDSREGDSDLFDSLLAWMASTEQDHTNTFRGLADSLRTGVALADDREFTEWNARWLSRLDHPSLPEAAAAMDATNPLYIPRNHLVEEALTAAEAGDLAPFKRLEAVLERPFEVQEGAERFAEPAPTSFGCYTTFCGT